MTAGEDVADGGETRPRVAIVGFGRAGGAIALALDRAGCEIAATWSRSRTGRRRANALCGAPVVDRPEQALDTADVVVVAVPDDAIREVADGLAPAVRPGRLVVHTSGSVSVEALSPVRDAGARIGSLHPLQTLPDPERGADALRGAAVAVTCEPEDRPFLSRLASRWGGRPFPLPDEAKTVYHTAAVFASNYVVSLLWAAAQLLEEAGVPRGSALLGPLVRSTVENVAEWGPEAALTGPVARGDLEAVRRHVGALAGRSAPEPLLGAYRALAGLTAAVASRDPEAVREVVEA